MLDHALCYAGRGWPVFPLSGYKTPFKGSHGHLDATTDPATITAWWTGRPKANIGLACGDIVVVDADGPAAIARLQGIGAAMGGLPRTLTAQTARGLHLFYRAPTGIEVRTRNEPRENKGADGIDIKGHGGYVVLAPSQNAKNGFVYKWILDVPLVELPLELLDALQPDKKAPAPLHTLGPRPAYLDQLQTPTAFHASAGLTPWSPEEEARIWSALEAIPATGYDRWVTIAMALHSLDWVRPDGTSPAYELFDDWSATEGEQYSPEATEKKWASLGKRSGVSVGSLFHIAEECGWTGNLPREYVGDAQWFTAPIASVGAAPAPVETGDGAAHTAASLGNVNGNHVVPTLLPGAFTAKASGSPLIELNQKYAVIGDVGGKCMVLSWIPSNIDPAIAVPSFQNFKTFTERHANRYVESKKKRKVLEEADDATEAEERDWVQLGTAWLKWPKRRTHERLDLVPNGERILPNNVLNLWTGFGVVPAPGDWSRMKAHIAEVLADNSTAALEYIIKWAAWAVQNPDKQAGAALVFRGDEGTGKGVFARTMCKLFGQHGVQLYNSKHMVGFNALLRNCLLLYADEAFWAGDKQGESTLKGLITEPSLVIEGKGVNAEMWRNRLHVIMTSNAEWVVPAGHSSRRYAVFDVANSNKQNESYFVPLYREMDNGGREAMLHDLLRVDLKGWQPSRIVKNKALEEQKARSLDPLADWYLNLLSEARLPGVLADGHTVPSGVLINNAQLYSRGLANALTSTKLGLFLRQAGCVKRSNVGKAGHNGWTFPPLVEARQRWESKYGDWSWSEPIADWQRH